MKFVPLDHDPEKSDPSAKTLTWVLVMAVAIVLIIGAVEGVTSFRVN